ncbi:MAG: hypothetical protein ACOX85_10620 [Candidatus Pararuminococcus gallinarum]
MESTDKIDLFSHGTETPQSGDTKSRPGTAVLIWERAEANWVRSDCTNKIRANDRRLLCYGKDG